MLKSIWRSLAALAALALAPASHAFTPESGFWWNPAESGQGYSIEIQDNYLFLLGYTYTAGGASQFVSAQGLLSGNARFQSTGNSTDGSWLNTFANGQCLGCTTYRAPTVFLGSSGPVTIVFNTETTATMTLAGRTFPIQRFDFFLTRSANDQRSDVMLGEWQIVMDLFDRGAAYQSYPYYGELLRFLTVDRSASTHFFDGCRPAISSGFGCTNAEKSNHPASGYYDAVHKEHVIVVTDTPGSTATTRFFFAYIATTGTDQFDGDVVVYRGDQDINTVLANGPFYPVRGFRSASRNFATSGTGPSSDAKQASADARATVEGLGPKLFAAGALPKGRTAAEVKAERGIDPTIYAEQIRTLTERLK